MEFSEDLIFYFHRENCVLEDQINLKFALRQKQ